MSSLLAASTRAPRRILATELCVSHRQTRLVSGDRRAPHLRLQKRGPYVLTPERQARLAREEERRARDTEVYNTRFEKNLKKAEMSVVAKAYRCRTTIEAAQDMTTRQAIFLWSYIEEYDGGTKSMPQSAIHVWFEKLSPMSLDDVYDMTFILRNKGTVACAQIGRRLVNLCAEFGHTEATIQVVASALRQAATKPDVWRSRNVAIALDRLREVAKMGNVRALVMEANVARHLGRVDQAIKQYQKAIDLILEDDGKQPGDKYSRIQDELSSPWIELAYLHHTQGQMVAAMKAYLAGQERDDPMAFFNLARLDLYMAGEHSHDWLYNMTKAAASGHYIAAHELGDYYANSAANPSKPEQSFMEKLTGFFKFLSKPNINLNPKTNIHHHDAFANTPQLRIRLAHEWFLTARQNHYLFANISLAQLYLQKLIYPEGTLRKPLDPQGHSDDPDAMDNPLFDPAKAQIMLTEVLTACLRIAEAKSVSKTNAEYIHRTRPWSNHQEVLEAVEETKTLQELKDQTEMIADAAGIDIYSTIGLAEEVPRLGFLRAHKGTRGEGLFEMPMSLEEQVEQAAKQSE